MQPIDVLLLYEHTVRELDVACAIKYYLQTGYRLTCEIVHQPYGVPAALQRWMPRLVILPFCYGESAEHYPFLYDWRTAIYVNLAWEQLLYSGNREAKLPRGEFERRHVLHHAWSRAFADILIERGIVPENTFVNGNPAYALYDSPYRDYFEDRRALAARYRLDPDKRWIFFPENYNWAFYHDWRVKDLARAGLTHDAMADMAQFCRDSFQEVVRWCNIWTRADDVELILRPRPATPLNEFVAAVQRLIPGRPSHWHITKEGTVREWILASDLVLSSYSTTLIEAAVAGKPAFMVEPYPIPASLSQPWHALLPHLTTLEEFERASSGEWLADERLGTWARATLMTNGDSILNLADWMGGLLRGTRRHPAPATRQSLISNHDNPVRAWFAFEKRRYQRRAERIALPHYLDPVYEKDVVQPSEIAHRVARWEKILNAQNSLPPRQALAANAFDG